MKNYREILMKKIEVCRDCHKADTWCDYHKGKAKRVSEFEKRINSLMARQDDPAAIDEVIEQLEEFLDIAR